MSNLIDSLIVCGAIPFRNRFELDKAIKGLIKTFGCNEKGKIMVKYDIDKENKLLNYHSFTNEDIDVSGRIAIHQPISYRL